MTPLEFLSQIPNHAEFSRSSKILLFAYYLRKFGALAEFKSADIRRTFREALIRIPSDLTTLLRELSRGSKSPLILGRVRNTFALSIHGVDEVEGILPAGFASPAAASYSDTAKEYLAKVLSRMPAGNRKDFLAEAISCLGVGARRSSVVMTWLVAMDHLYEYVLVHNLADFNTALHKRTDAASRVTIANHDDFGDIKESVFIEVCRSAGIVTPDVRKILDEKLGFRNSCAHPSSITVGEAKGVSFIEDIVDNVITKYPI